jgi:glycerol uptake facilitator protein
LAHALLPVRKPAPADAVLVPVGAGAPAPVASPQADAKTHGKDSDWGYAWVPVLGPLVGGALAGLAAQFLF